MQPLANAHSLMTPALLRRGNEMNTEIRKLTGEVTTGLASDLGQALHGNFSALAGVNNALSRLESYNLATNEAGLLAGSMQSALTAIDDKAMELASDLNRMGAIWTEARLNRAGSQGKQAFETAVSMLNSSVGGRSMFSGTSSSSTALPETDVILDALMGELAGVTTAAGAETVVADWFSDPAGFAALYQGGPGREPVTIAPGERADLGITALDGDLRETLKGLAMAALIDKGFLAGQEGEREQLLEAASLGLIAASSDRSLLMARLGTAEYQISSAKARNAAEGTSLQIARTGMIEADPYEAATRLKDLESRLDAFYTLTARFSRLSLTEYLR